MRDSKSKYRQRRQEERRDRIVDALETASDAAYRGSEALLVWLFSPNRPARTGKYLQLWAKVVGMFVAAFVVLGEYAHWRAPYYFGAETIFANPEFLEMLLDTTWSFIRISGLVIAFAWAIHHASWEASRRKERRADRLRAEQLAQEHEQATTTD